MERDNSHYCQPLYGIAFCVLAFMFGTTVYFYANIEQFEQASTYDYYLQNKQLMAAFQSFTTKYHRYYLTEDERLMRLAIFAENYQKINEFNQQKDTFTLAINKFTDLTDEEYQTYYLMPSKPTNVENFGSESQIPVGDDVQIDYTNKVGRVKDQGVCGSCWSFAAIGAVEFVYSSNTGNLVEFSEQQVVDCCKTTLTQGCNGGEANDALACAQNSGVVKESDYPYMGIDNICREKPVVFKTASQGHTTPGDNDALLTRLKLQPLDISVNAASYFWRFYSSGIISKGCSWAEIDHDVLLLGASTDQATGLPYWKIKNSWGPNWGSNGFIYILREQGIKPAQCAMNLHNYYPTYGNIN